VTQPPIQGDPRAETVLRAVLQCLCDTLAAAGRGVCCCWWIPGQRGPLAYGCHCKCDTGAGTAFIRLARRRFDALPPQRGFGGAACGVRRQEVWEVQAGVVRCWPEPKNGLPCADMTAFTADTAWDELLVQQALTCCAPLKPYAIGLSEVRQIGPAGGCIGAQASFELVPPPLRAVAPPAAARTS